MNKTDNNRRLLIVDDNRAIHDDFRKILCPSLRADGEKKALEDVLFGEVQELPRLDPFVVDSAYQGQEGLQAVQRACADGRPYAVAFVDVRMPPGWDGIQTTKEIWKVDPEIQVVICTAYSDYSWAEMMSQLGQSDRLVVLKKPFDNIEALQLVHALTTKWELSRQAHRRVEELDGLVAERTEQLRSANEKLLGDIEVRRQTELRLAAFAALGNRLGAARDPRAAAAVVVELADQLIGWDACVCELYSPAEDRLSHVLGMDIINGRKTECDPQYADHKPAALAEKVIREGGQLVLQNDPQAVPSDTLPFGDKTRLSASILYVPIRNGTAVIGVLSIQSYKPNAYDRRSLETLQGLADHCASALNRLKSEEILRQTEQQLRQAQKMESIGQLAGGVAHDFNNILAVILMQSDLLKVGGNLTPEQLGFANEIAATVQRASSLTRQLLLFSRREVFQPCNMDLSEAIVSTTRMLRRIVGEDVEIQLHLASQPLFVHADVSMMDQVLLNLVVNARDAMPGGGRLVIETSAVEIDALAASHSPQSRPGSFARLSVTDTGCGIPPEILPRIFEPFFTTKDIGKGTGLGLATVFGIAQQHQGWVNVTSQIGRGTTFQIYLPRLANSAAPKKSSPALSAVRGGTETILLVEDDPSLRASVRIALSRRGYHIVEAPSGVKALDVWKENRGDIRLLLTDLVMPDGINGKELARRLVDDNSELKVVYMSGYSVEVAGMDLPLREGDNFLAKPFQAHKLAQVIRNNLDLRANAPEKQ
jgi:signal transduction histidine kinase/DNA-binding response OmpR family regulator